jgi:hypothetical protein
MCEYIGSLCKRSDSGKCAAPQDHQINYFQPVEWTGACQDRPSHRERKHWSQKCAPPLWACKSHTLVGTKKFMFAELCEWCRREKKESKKRKREVEDDGGGKSPESSRLGSLMHSYSFKETAKKSLVVLRLQRLLAAKKVEAKKVERAQGEDKEAVVKRTQKTARKPFV